jgi:transcription initiation factor TFIIH subunit 2
MHTKKEHLDKFNAGVNRRSMIRYLTIIVDFSAASLKQEMRPNRATCTKEILRDFLLGFKDQNPLSKVSMIVTCRQKAIVLGDFEKSVEQVMAALQTYDDFEGMPSMQQALEFARIQVDKCVPDYALKEVLIINSSITICDPGDIRETLATL